MKRSLVMDVGSSKVSFLDSSASAGALIINSFRTCPYSGYSLGRSPDAPSFSDAVDELLSQGVSAFDLRTHGITVGVPAPFITTAVTTRYADTPSGRVRDADLELLLDRGENIEPPSGFVLMHTTPFDYAVNGIPCGGSPVGLKSKRLTAKFCHAFVSERFHALVSDAVESCGAHVSSFISLPMACASFTIPFNARMGGAVLVDCGGTHCDVSAIRSNAVLSTESFGIGGIHFAKDIAYGFELPLDTAEELKRGYRFASGGAGPDEPVRPAGDPSLVFDAAELAFIVESRAEEFADRLSGALTSVEKLLPAGSPVYLVGGGLCGMRGLADYLSEKTGRSIIINAPKAGKLNGLRHIPPLSIAHFMLYDGGMPLEASSGLDSAAGRLLGSVKGLFTPGLFARRNKS